MQNDQKSVKRTRLATTLLLFATLTACSGDDTPPGQVLLAGTVEAREVGLAFRVNGRIDSLGTDEGQVVSKGQTVAQLDAEPYRLAVERAAAETRAAREALAALQAGSRKQEIRAAQAALAAARAELAYARSDLDRIERLVRQKLAPQERLDQTQLRVRSARAGVTRAQEELALLREGPRQEDIRRAQAQFEASKAALATAREQLGFATLDSPVNGVVSVRMAEAGEVVAAGQPVFRVSELGHPWVRAYLSETDLARVTLGQKARVKVDGLDRTFEGKLTFISPEAEFTPKTVETRELRTGLVYRVKVQVDNPEGVLKLGMPADVILPVSSNE
jgi:HlyD family secretion protein